MKYKRLGWLASIRYSQELRLKGVIGLVISIFVIRDVYFVKKSMNKAVDPKNDTLN